MALVPSVFAIAVIIEYFDRLEPFALIRRGVISVLILVSVTSFYHKSIDASMEIADAILGSQKGRNILLMDMLSADKYLDQLDEKRKKGGFYQKFYQDKSVWQGTLHFLRFHLFDSFVNDGFSSVIFFIVQLCFLLLKVVYSLIYYLGYALIGIPCLIYLFPTMGNVLRGAILSFVWCLVMPHVLVFILSMIGSEINRGYVSGEIIGGSIMGTALLFIFALFVASTPLITAMILNGSGVSQAGGIIATMGGHWILSLPKSAVTMMAAVATGGVFGSKSKVASALKGIYRMATNKALSFSTGRLNSRQKSSSNRNNGQQSPREKSHPQPSLPQGKKGENANGSIQRHGPGHAKNEETPHLHSTHGTARAHRHNSPGSRGLKSQNPSPRAKTFEPRSLPPRHELPHRKPPQPQSLAPRDYPKHQRKKVQNGRNHFSKKS